MRLEKLSEGWEDIKEVFHYQSFPYISKIIYSKLLNKHYNILFKSHFDIKKMQELINKKYYWLMLHRDIKAHIKGFVICLALKIVCYKPYKDLQSLSVLTYWWKNRSINFVTSLPISDNWKKNSYNSILVIVDQLRKMIHYESVKVMIIVLSQAIVIINMIIYYYRVLESIVIDCDLLFISKFWSLLYYFLKIKKKLFTVFYPEING